MGELTGELIQMNAHMVVTHAAKESIVIGLFCFIIFVLWTIVAIRSKSKLLAILCAIIALSGAALFSYGVATPRAKEIKACANGPISLELISSRYDILKIDGKELTLRVR